MYLFKPPSMAFILLNKRKWHANPHTLIPKPAFHPFLTLLTFATGGTAAITFARATQSTK
jgi:hypothetical protein